MSNLQVAYQLAQGSDVTIDVSRLGDIATAHYLFVMNSGNANGVWQVDMM